MEQRVTIAQYLSADSVKNSILQVMSNKAPQFIASVTSLVNSNDSLKAADHNSILNACLTAATLDLPINPNLGFAYVIPYKDNKSGVTYAQFQMGYKGYIQLAMRSGQFKTINATEVKEGEIVSRNLLTGEIEFAWGSGEERFKSKTIGFVAYFKLLNGFEKILYMTANEIESHGIKFSKTYKKGYGLWKDDFESMAKKTVLKLLLSKYAPMNVEMQKAILADQAIVKDDGYEYVDNDIENQVKASDDKKAAIIAAAKEHNE
jgi:recombination protein RecT